MPRLVKLEKNYIDPLAAFQMLQGSNLVHLSMVLAIFFVDYGYIIESVEEIYNLTVFKGRYKIV